MDAVYRLLRRRLNWFGEARPVPDTAVAGSETHYSFTRSQDQWASELPRRDGEPQPRNAAESILRKRITALTATEARFHSLTLLGSDWHWDQDAQFRFTAVGGNLADPIAATIEKYLGRTLWELPQVEPPEGGWDAHRRCLNAQETFRDLVLRRQRQDGSASYVSISGEPVFAKDGTFLGYRGIGLDITKQKLIEAKISRLARFDPLTGLYNRTAFFERLNHALAVARRHDRAIALLFVDLDRFKDVNDAFGHVSGDEVLKVMARPAHQGDQGHRHGRTAGR